MSVFHGVKGMEVIRCSTGEQKALLVCFILAQLKFVEKITKKAPLVLFDEVAAHFDALKREKLYAILKDTGAQVWMTGADKALFSSLGSQASLFNVKRNSVFPF